MGNILAFTTSGREESVSNRLVHRAVELARQQGHTVQLRDLVTDPLQGCKGCRHCRTQEGCTIPDGFWESILHADGIIVGFPIYFSGIAGQGKLWIDRLYPMIDAQFRARHPGKKVLVFYCQGDQNAKQFQSSIFFTDYVFKMCGWQQLDSILCAGTAEPGYEISDAVWARTETAVKKF